MGQPKTEAVYSQSTIAAFTFAEIALSIRGIIIGRKNKMPLVQAIKLINLSASIICLTLTQVALMSFSAAGYDPLCYRRNILQCLFGNDWCVYGFECEEASKGS